MNNARARAAHLLRTEGVRGLVTGVAGHLNEVRRSVACVERYVIYQFDTDTGCGPLRAPRIDGLEVFVVEREEDLNALAARGLEVPVSHPTLRRGWLRCGGVAFCAYVNRELAHVAWVALADAARGCSMDCRTTSTSSTVRRAGEARTPRAASAVAASIRTSVVSD